MNLYFKRVLLVLLLGIVAFSTPPVVLTVASYIYFQWSDVILPGIRVGEVEVGGMPVSEAREAIDHFYNQEMKLRLVEAPVEGRTWSVSPDEFGLRVDPIKSAAAAHELGRQGHMIMQVDSMLSVLNEGREIQPEVSYAAETANLALEAWSNVLFKEAVDAAVALSGSEIEMFPAQAGLRVDKARTLSTLSNNYRTIYLEQGWMPIFTSQIQPQRAQVDLVVQDLEALLARQVEVTAYDPVTDERFAWRVDSEDIASWIALTDQDGQIQIELNTEGILGYVEELNVFLGPERNLDQEVVASAILDDLLSRGSRDDLHIITYLPSEYVVQPGDNLVSIGFKVHMPHWKLQEVNPILASQSLSTGQTLKVPPRDDLLALPVIPEKRIVISIGEQRMWVYESGTEKWAYTISTGIPNSPTLPGIFQISSHFENAYASIWDLYMPHFMGIYDAVPGLTNGIHGLPVLSNGQRLWANVLGSPASYGCIILDLEAAENLYYWAEDGVVVEIQE